MSNGKWKKRISNSQFAFLQLTNCGTMATGQRAQTVKPYFSHLFVFLIRSAVCLHMRKILSAHCNKPLIYLAFFSSIFAIGGTQSCKRSIGIFQLDRTIRDLEQIELLSISRGNVAYRKHHSHGAYFETKTAAASLHGLKLFVSIQINPHEINQRTQRTRSESKK